MISSKRFLNHLPSHYRILTAFLVAFIGFIIAAKPAYYLLRQQWLNHLAAESWQQFKLTNREPESGEPVVWLNAPQAGLETIVLWDVTEENLRKFPAWSVLSSGPHQAGLGMIFGHRDAHFRKLDKLKTGHTIEVEGLTGFKQYRVASIEVVDRSELSSALTGSHALEEGLVLITCYPFRYAGPAPQRYLVWLEPVKKQPQALPPLGSQGSSEKCISAW